MGEALSPLSNETFGDCGVFELMSAYDCLSSCSAYLDAKVLLVPADADFGLNLEVLGDFSTTYHHQFII